LVVRNFSVGCAEFRRKIAITQGDFVFAKILRLTYGRHEGLNYNTPERKKFAYSSDARGIVEIGLAE
jgi:hypothetical protein